MEDLSSLREKIDAADSALLSAFLERMDLSEKIAEYKAQKGLPVLDPARERQKLADVLSRTPEKYTSYAAALYSLLFELSRTHQHSILHPRSELVEQIRKALETTDRVFPQSAPVACQGVDGAFSQLACEKLFNYPNILFFNSFDAVFSAIEAGLCRYGVLPLENSTAGSINKVYDLMMQHRFYIVRSVRLKVDHSLLAKPGASLSNIKEIYSHAQAISQCAGFLATLPGVKVIECENTAAAAKMVAESDRLDIAALSSRYCADLYGLVCLKSSVQDKGNNYTRFICISKDLEIYPGADKTSLMLSIPHKPGSLYRVLSRFYTLGINLNKLESRPLPDRDFEFMFYFDLDTPVYSDALIQLIGQLETTCDDFRYLGSYSEVV